MAHLFPGTCDTPVTLSREAEDATASDGSPAVSGGAAAAPPPPAATGLDSVDDGFQKEAQGED